MNEQGFCRMIDQAFWPFLSELGFFAKPKSISGRAYIADFIGPAWTLSVSFEPGDDFFAVILLNNELKGLAAVDNREKSPRLSDLNARYMGEVTPAERQENDVFFSDVIATDPHERQLPTYTN
jgi:hypothetical protein